MGIGEVDRDTGDGGESGVLGHLSALVPGDGGVDGPGQGVDHAPGGVGDGAAEGFSDCLVSQAHAQQGFVGVSGPLDGVDNDSGVGRGTGAG